VLLSTLVATSSHVAATRARLTKIQLLSDLLKQARPDEIEIVIAYLSGTILQSSIGVGWATLEKAKSHAAATPSVEIQDVHATLETISKTAGKGSAGEKQRLLGELFRRATKDEQQFLFRLLTGELRQGALEGIMIEAVAKARALPASEVRRAVMLAGDLGAAAKGDVKGFAIELFRPIKPMLAKSAETVAEALAELGPSAFEYKFDGIRIQVHKKGDEVRVYSRMLHDITGELPGVVEFVRRLPASSGVFDGEALSGVASFFFDILYLDGASLIDLPYSTRSRMLAEQVPEAQRPPRLVTADSQAAQAFFEQALQTGHEGLMAKALDSGYAAGRRKGAWIKLKRANTLDLVVLAAEWGHGRRQGKLSNLHLGARDPKGGFVMLGKTFKGMTDALLEWQTAKLQAIKVREVGHVVHVRPELVVEIAFNGLQESTRYPGGLALRFARVIRYRDDKRPEDADTIESVRRLAAG
jgi:DNA ligase-1